MTASEIPQRARIAVLRRAGGRCERCGSSGPLEIHHRRYRSRGGSHELSNLVALCGWGNHTGCHGWAHTDPLAHDWGYSVHSWGKPAEVLLWSDPQWCWYQLDDAGNRTRVG